MGRIKMLFCASMAMLALLALGSASASALSSLLPDITLLSGTSFPFTGEGETKKTSSETEISLQTAADKLPAEQLKAKLEVTTLGPSGSITLDFLGVHEKESKDKCHTSGGAEGEVVIKGEFNLVFTSGETLALGMLISFGETKIECTGALGKISVKGPLMGTVSAGSGFISSFSVSFHCKSAGSQELSSYYNDESKQVTSQLLKTNFGLGGEAGCQEVHEALKITTSKSFEIGGANLPSVSLAAVGGGTELNFMLMAAGSTKEIKIENPAAGPNIPAALGGNFIEEGGGRAEETNFLIVAGGTCTIPDEVLIREQSCTVRVEFRSGAANRNAQYVLKYGNRLRPNAAVMRFAVKSE